MCTIYCAWLWRFRFFSAPVSCRRQDGLSLETVHRRKFGFQGLLKWTTFILHSILGSLSSFLYFDKFGIWAHEIELKFHWKSYCRFNFNARETRNRKKHMEMSPKNPPLTYLKFSPLCNFPHWIFKRLSANESFNWLDYFCIYLLCVYLCVWKIMCRYIKF
jgi:hypothetical protein